MPSSTGKDSHPLRKSSGRHKEQIDIVALESIQLTQLDMLTQHSGMDVVEQIYAGYGEEPSQGSIEREGNAYLEKKYPLLSYIANTRSMQADDGTKEDGNGDN